MSLLQLQNVQSDRTDCANRSEFLIREELSNDITTTRPPPTTFSLGTTEVFTDSASKDENCLHATIYMP